jgi:hypothetical protein
MQRTRSHSDSSLLLLVDLPGMMRKAWSHVFIFEGYVFETHVCVSLHFVLFHFEITAVCLTPRRGFLISFHFTSACFLFVLACQCSFCFRIPFVCPIAVMLFQLLPGGGLILWAFLWSMSFLIIRSCMKPVMHGV